MPGVVFSNGSVTLCRVSCSQQLLVIMDFNVEGSHMYIDRVSVLANADVGDSTTRACKGSLCIHIDDTICLCAASSPKVSVCFPSGDDVYMTDKLMVCSYFRIMANPIAVQLPH